MKILDVPRSGSLGGQTSSHNRAGQYVRNRRTPTNTPTTRRTAARGFFATASAAYAGLTETQRLAWQAYADDHPITDALGQAIKLTGHQMFVSINAALLNVNADMRGDPPGDSTSLTVGTVAAQFSVATGLTVNWDIPAGSGQVAIALSGPTSAGRSSPTSLTQVGVIAIDEAPFQMQTAAYTAQFGTLVAGQKVFVKVTPVNADGVTGVAGSGVAVAAA